jgi:hypothetical protein
MPTNILEKLIVMPELDDKELTLIRSSLRGRLEKNPESKTEKSILDVLDKLWGVRSMIVTSYRDPKPTFRKIHK